MGNGGLHNGNNTNRSAQMNTQIALAVMVVTVVLSHLAHLCRLVMDRTVMGWTLAYIYLIGWFNCFSCDFFLQ